MNIDNYLAGSLLLVSFVVISALGVIPFRKIRGIKRLTSHHEVMGYFFPVAGSIYGLLLGMVVVNSISVFDAARARLNEESTSLVSIYMLAENFPAPERTKIRQYCRDYTQSVISQEWNRLDQGEHHPVTREYAANLFKELIKVSTVSSNAGQKILDLGQTLIEARRDRLDISARSIPAIEWFTLCTGGVLIILFSYLFVTDSLFVQVFGTGIIAIMISLNLYLVVVFSGPFSGDLKVSQLPMVKAIDTFNNIDSIYTHGPTPDPR